MLHTKQELAHFAIDAAIRRMVSPALVCAIIDVSSQWNAAMEEWEPESWILCNHPNDFPGGEEEYLCLGTRWGLMQFTGARLKLAGWKGPYSRELGEPKSNLDAGCWLLNSMMKADQSAKTLLLNWFGLTRRPMANAVLMMLPGFERFVAERPVQTVV